MRNKIPLHARSHAAGGSDPIETTSSGSGIQFDTDNEGGWLYVQVNDTTEGSGSTRGYALDLQDRSTSVGGSGGIRVKTFNDLRLESNSFAVLLSHNDVVTVESDAVLSFPSPGILLTAPTAAIDLTGDSILIQGSGAAGNLTIGSAGNVQLTGTSLVFVGDTGFYGATAVAQAAHPSTLGDVITLLTDLGLCA